MCVSSSEWRFASVRLICVSLSRCPIGWQASPLSVDLRHQRDVEETLSGCVAGDRAGSEWDASGVRGATVREMKKRSHSRIGTAIYPCIYSSILFSAYALWVD